MKKFYRAIMRNGLETTEESERFFDVITMLATKLGVPESDMRYLKRSPETWFVYRSELQMVMDMQHGQKIRWVATVYRQSRLAQ